MCKKCWTSFRWLKVPSCLETTFKEKMRKSVLDCNEWVCYGQNCPWKWAKLDLTTFLRHVSRNKSCLESYDPKYLDYLKRESRLKTKREWLKRNYDSRIKDERKSKKKDGMSMNNHVGLEKRTTEAGRALHLLFYSVFKTHKQQIKARIEAISNSTTMDLKAKSFNALIYGNSVQDTGINEEWCKVKLQEIVNERKKISPAKLYEIIMHGFFKHCLDRAFCTYMKDIRFLEIFSNAQDAALDKILSELITTKYFPEDINKLEAKMTETFQNMVSKELEKTSKESGLYNDMVKLITNMLEKKLKDFFPEL